MAEKFKYQDAATIAAWLDEFGSRNGYPECAEAASLLRCGTFACPICGKDTPHHHSADELAMHRDFDVTARERLGRIKRGASYADAVMEVYGSEPKGRFFDDLAAIIPPPQL